MRALHLRSCLALLLLSVVAVLAGCVADPIKTQTTVLVPVAGGETARMSFGGHGPVLEENDDFKVRSVNLSFSKDLKHFYFVFTIEAKNGAEPKTVTITDITQDPVMPLLEDDLPIFVKGVWKGQMTPMDAKDPRLAWLLNVDDSLLVFQFTVVLADGRESSVRQAISYQAALKQQLRKSLGLTY